MKISRPHLSSVEALVDTFKLSIASFALISEMWV